MEKMEISNIMIFTHDELISFMYSKNDNITPIRIQKFAYFSYCYWLNHQKYKLGLEYNKITFLFPAVFEAWKFGPVDKKLYTMTKLSQFSKHKIDLENKTEIYLEAYNFLNFMWERLLSKSDFQLVALSHQDNGWINSYNERDVFHENDIDKNLIIEQYTSKEYIYG
jgi:uncharacterized phage-associated protein